MRIGEVALRAGVNVQTLRYYERRGLLREPARSPSGYRQYDADAVRVIRFIKRAQELGFSLREVEELLQLRANKRAKCADVMATALAKLDDIDRKVRSLQSMRQALKGLVASCKNGASLDCPILEALDGTERKERGT